MNCRSAQPLLSAERDGALSPHERAGLEAHVAGCAECQRFQAAVAKAGGGLRVAAARVKVPDEERAWQDIHREIRAGRPAAAKAWWNLGRWTLPVGAAAAALAVVAVITPNWTGDDAAQETTQVARVGQPQVARAEFVEVGNDASSMVYVDDKSGWLVVWATPTGKSG